MSYGLRSLSLCVLLALSTSCVPSKNPIHSPPRAAVEPTAFLGHWELAKIGEVDFEEGKRLRVTVKKRSDGSVTASWGKESCRETMECLLTTLKGKTVLSLGSEDSWQIWTVSLEDGGLTMVLRTLDPNIIKQDIEKGLLQGRVYPFVDQEDDGVRITASREDLRAYLGDKPGVFEEEAVVLHKVVK